MYKLSPFTFSFSKSGKAKKIFLDEEIVLEKNEIVAIVGPSGGGKSTLLKILKGIIPEYSSGKLEGEITFQERSLTGHNFEENLKSILYLFQNPFSQLIYPTTEEEFLFSMENFNFTREEMDSTKKKFEELFNLKNIWGKKTTQLSNGECQKLVLASMLAINPKVLLLDEPTAFLDPEARREFYNFLNQVKGERLIVIVDHHLEEIKDLVTRMIGVSKEGKVTDRRNIYSLERYNTESISIEGLGCLKSPAIKLSIKDVSFSYDPKVSLLKNLNADFKSGEIIAIKGKNGEGKSSLFKLVAGVMDPDRGAISFESGKDKILNNKIFPHVGFIFQNPESHFFFDTIEEELKQSFKNIKSEDFKAELLRRFFHEVDLKKSPFLLSEGEKRRLSILMTVFLGKDLLLYDEPTFGQDQNSIQEIASLMKELKKLGIIQLYISHDDKFIRETADRVLLLESGSLNEIS